MNVNTENKTNHEDYLNVDKVIQITRDELDRSLATSRYWNKEEVYSYLSELKERIEYKISKFPRK